MKAMTRHGSATLRPEASQNIDASLNDALNQRFNTFTNSLANPVRFGNKNPCLAQLVRRVEGGEMTIDRLE